MKKNLVAKLAVLILTIATLSGCILVPVDDGYQRGDRHDNGLHRGDKHGDRH